jgi:hypothetical protein
MAEAKKEKLIKTSLNHVYYLDVNDDGQYREVAVVKKDGNGSVYYIDVQLLDNVDKGRLKKIVTDIHADKYELWDLMSQKRLSNGINALDYFHRLVRVKKAPGAVNTAMGGGLLSVRPESDTLVGSQFSDPSSGVIES